MTHTARARATSFGRRRSSAGIQSISRAVRRRRSGSHQAGVSRLTALREYGARFPLEDRHDAPPVVAVPTGEDEVGEGVTSAHRARAEVVDAQGVWSGVSSVRDELDAAPVASVAASPQKSPNDAWPDAHQSLNARPSASRRTLPRSSTTCRMALYVVELGSPCWCTSNMPTPLPPPLR